MTEADFDFGVESICASAAAAAAAGVDLFQIREKKLSTRAVHRLAASVVAAAGGKGMKILVNDRADVAKASGADGVHLTSTSLEAGAVRQAFGEAMLIGVSTHNDVELRRAKEGGADFVTFSPIFETESKRGFGPPQGTDTLRKAVAVADGLPVIALGGITVANADECLSAGAAGIAGIGLFREPVGFESVVADLRK